MLQDAPSGSTAAATEPDDIGTEFDVAPHSVKQPSTKGPPTPQLKPLQLAQQQQRSVLLDVRGADQQEFSGGQSERAPSKSELPKSGLAWLCSSYAVGAQPPCC